MQFRLGVSPAEWLCIHTKDRCWECAGTRSVKLSSNVNALVTFLHRRGTKSSPGVQTMPGACSTLQQERHRKSRSTTRQSRSSNGSTHLVEASWRLAVGTRLSRYENAFRIMSYLSFKFGSTGTCGLQHQWPLLLCPNAVIHSMCNTLSWSLGQQNATSRYSISLIPIPLIRLIVHLALSGSC